MFFSAALTSHLILSLVQADSCLKVDLNDASFEVVRENTINEEESVEYAFDGDIHTKWLDYSGGNNSWVQVDIQSPQAVTTYGIVSGNDASERDPMDWVFSASADHGETWTELDVQTGVVFSAREQRQAFEVNEEGELYQYYRFNVTAVAGTYSDELMQVSEVELWMGSECHDPCCGVDCGNHGSCDRTTGECRCEDYYSGIFCDSADTQWIDFSGRIFTNSELVWYKTTTLDECQTRCSMDWYATETPCIGISFRMEDNYCFLYHDPDNNGPTLESNSGYSSYLAFVA